MVGLSKDMTLCAMHVKCITIIPQNIQLACSICGDMVLSQYTLVQLIIHALSVHRVLPHYF